jgi:protein-disulfide isomerase
MPVLSAAVAGTLLFGCAGGGATPQGSDEPEVLARVSDTPVTVSDLGDQVEQQLSQLENQYQQRRFQLLDAALERAIQDRLLEEEAARLDLTVDELLAAEGEDRLEIDEEDISTWYEQNKARLRGRSLDDLRASIHQFLVRTRQEEIRNVLVARLRAGKEVVSYLEPPRFALDNEGAPALGPDAAKVTLVEFSDFECPYCRSFLPTLRRLRDDYAERLRIVYRQFPLNSLHPNAAKAAEASLCAHDQGRFWEMHDLLFEERELEAGALFDRADRLGLDRADFDECMDSGRHAARIQEDLREGSLAGVTGTPALFVNGIPVPGGAVPYETVAQAIDRELRRVEEG